MGLHVEITCLEKQKDFDFKDFKILNFLHEWIEKIQVTGKNHY